MRIRVGHIGLQFSDSPKEQSQTINKIFDRGQTRRLGWITGTEAGPGSGQNGELLLELAPEHGYKIWIPAEQSKSAARHSGSWIAVREDLIAKGSWRQDYDRVIPGSQELYTRAGHDDDLQPRWGPRGLVHVGFTGTPKGMGRIHVGTAHYLVSAQDPKRATTHDVNRWEWNEKLAEHIGAWAREKGKGDKIAFYAGDQNMNDARNKAPEGDTFMGQPLTSSSDELKKWEGTHGDRAIDVIASYNKDKRVKALRVNVLNDREFFLHTDHKFLETVFTIDPISS